MHILTAVNRGAVLVLGIALLIGCKKESSQTMDAHQTVPAPSATPAPMEQAKTGEELFKQHCAGCHPDGGTVIKPEYSLHGKALAAHNITKPADIVKIMRIPGQGMNSFVKFSGSIRHAPR